MHGLSPTLTKMLAHAGAETVLKRLEADAEAIRKAFPELRRAKRRRVSHMSAKARKATSLRMKRYWAERRKRAA